GREPGAHAAVQHAHRPEPHGHGDVLQAGPGRPDEAPAAQVESLRLRGGDHGPPGAGGRPDLGAADLLQRAHLRRGQEDHVARRGRRAAPHPPLQPVSAAGRVAAAIDQAAHFTPRRAGLAVTCAALAVGALALNRQLIGVFYDDGLYAGIAVALAQGMGYVHPHLPGAPAAVHYPPLWPVLLAPLFAMFRLDTAALLGKILNLLLAAAGAGVVLYLLVVRRAPWAHLAAAAAPVALAGLGWGLWLARHRGGLDPAMAMNYGSYFETVQAAGVGVFWPSLRDLPRPLGDLT